VIIVHYQEKRSYSAEKRVSWQSYCFFYLKHLPRNLISHLLEFTTVIRKK